MNLERFLSGQRKAANFVFAAFVISASVMWVATLCDFELNLGWGWDKQILWLAPPMVLFAVVLRFLWLTILRSVGGGTNGS